MNMLLHGIKFSNFKIENGDTLEWDAFGDTQFDAVVANPPFSAEWSAADKFTYIIHSGFISGYQNRYGDNLKPPTNVYHRMTA